MSLPPFYPPWKHDVFVSFKGGDVIETFVSHLFERLKQVGIGHFGDNKREDAGENIERKCLVAFEEARFALVVFSTNYVDCSRCLSWLVKILDCKRDSKLVVVPIFYEDRAKVLNFARDGKFERALENVETKEKYAEKKKWGRALEEAGKIRGYYELKPYNSERNLIDKIVGRLVNKIHSRYPGKDFVFGPFGGEDRNNQKPFKIEKIDGRGNDGKEKENDGKGIHVKYGDFIKSVTFEVPEGTRTEPQNDGMSLFMVKLKEGEYITSFAGSKNANEEGILINSFTFRTNRRILGPIGREKEEEKEEKKEEKEEEDKMKKKDKKQKKKEEEETQKKKEEEEEEKKKKQKEEEKKKEEAYFSVPLDAGKVTEFFWRKKGDFLESVGASVQLHPEGFNPFLSVGLFGREDGKEWNDERTHANVNKITVWIDQKEEEKPDSSNAQKKKKKALAKNEELDPSGGPFIRLIEFTYEENNGILGEPKKHGSETGLDMKKKPHIIQLDADEYLTSISGYYTDVISRRYRDFGITSLTFRTNKQMAITIGEEKGIYFSSPATAGKIVGFYGWSDQHLCGIGAHFEPISDLLPFGGGSVMDGVREICPFLKPDGCIHRIELVYDNRRGEDCTFTYGPTEGVSNAIEPKKLDYPREYLTSISGYVGEDDGAIKSLTFYSNKQRFLIGKEEKGKYYFWYPSAGSRIIGLCGSGAPTYIGVHVEPIPHLYPFKTVGPPMKGFGGDPWDDGVYTNVRGYRVTTSRDNNKNKIESITFMYDNNGSLVEGDRHGGGEASTGEWEMLDFPKVRLLRIQGHMREEDGETIIHNLTMVPTKGPSVPYAPREDKTSSTHFVIPEKAEDGRIVGLFGMAKRHLNSIGVRLEPY